ncbi:J domain-containing protein [Leptolyngbya sp. AN02str]|uniref:J domain-containing protein n=1 Tax=Leptolyngbya sp. AN02str TaxID=3423363 RepID=UPI003D3109C8
MAAKKKPQRAKSEPQITPRIEVEIKKLAAKHGYDESILNQFALFVLSPEPKPLTLPELKKAVYDYFQVKDTAALKKSNAFQLATSGLGKLDLSKKAGWETIYRKVVAVIPTEEYETGYGCINGIDIFKYDKPWKVFGLDPKTSSTEDVKKAYYNLSQTYHPDRETGDAEIFNRLTVFYKSLTEKF